MSGGLLPVLPRTEAERDLWVVAQRGPRHPVSATQPYAFLVEQERFADGSLGEVATIFLTNRECPWRCVMCDLWRNTLPTPVSPGDIPRQIRYALERLPSARQVKLYNSGSFFDTGAIPPEDYAAIASLLRGFERVIVECHPALVGTACARFRDLLQADLEVAMGLETVHPEVLPRLGKKMTLEQYAGAAEKLRTSGIALRSFVLLQPPFMKPEDAVPWACRSIDFAQTDCAATAVALIPTRGGNGAMETLLAHGEFTEPRVAALEEAFAASLGRGGGRVFVDLWDFPHFAPCPQCRDERRERLRRMNHSQQVEPCVRCTYCGEGA